MQMILAIQVGDLGADHLLAESKVPELVDDMTSQRLCKKVQ